MVVGSRVGHSAGARGPGVIGQGQSYNLDLEADPEAHRPHGGNTM